MRTVIVFLLLAFVLGCTISPTVSGPPPVKQTLANDTAARLDDPTRLVFDRPTLALLDDGSTITLPPGSVATVPAGTGATLPAGTELDGGFGAVLMWFLVIVGVVAVLWLYPKFLRAFRKSKGTLPA